MDKKLAEESKVTVDYAAAAPKKKESDPVQRAITWFTAGLGIIILLIVGASISNTGNFYLESSDGALEIWQGRFAPMGEKLLLSLPGVENPNPIKKVYTKDEVYPLAFNYYLGKADDLLQAPGLPDFEGIKNYADKAIEYAATPEMHQAAQNRLDKIDRMVLIYKADIAASRGTRDDLEQALIYLKNAEQISTDDVDLAMIAHKQELVEASLAEIKAQEAETEAGQTAEEASEAPAAKAGESSEAPTQTPAAEDGQTETPGQAPESD